PSQSLRAPAEYRDTPQGPTVYVTPHAWARIQDTAPEFRGMSDVTFTGLDQADVDRIRRTGEARNVPELVSFADALEQSLGNGPIIVSRVGEGRDLSQSKIGIRHERFHQALE